MPSKVLHIISFDNPYPPRYGGVIDVFYKVKALHGLGCKIHLHCFVTADCAVAPELAAITEAVYFYRKIRMASQLFSRIPFAVKTRFDERLLENVIKVDAPILFEGLQTTMLMHRPEIKNRQKFLRLHNLESNFFSGTSKSEKNPIMKLLYFAEALKYTSYQKMLSSFAKVFSLSVHEHDFTNRFSGNSCYVPVFHGNHLVREPSAFGDYCFYHGDLRLADNKRAVEFLIRIFQKLPDIRFLMASDNGKDFVENQIRSADNISFVELTSGEHLEQLLAGAHINVMMSFQMSGTKLKLVNSIFNSRFCLINKNMVDDPRILDLCELASSEEEFIEKIRSLSSRPYDDNGRRNKVLLEVLNDFHNAEKIMEVIFRNDI